DEAVLVDETKPKEDVKADAPGATSSSPGLKPWEIRDTSLAGDKPADRTIVEARGRLGATTHEKAVEVLRRGVVRLKKKIAAN
ncbi:unnamed protein product, partial [Amoebophrya sp. A25]